MKKLLGFNKVICFSPHPDDVEISMSGTILKYPDTQFDILYMSNGTFTDSTAGNNRIMECESFWKCMNPSNVNILPNSIKYINALTEDKWIELIETEYNIQKYDAIFSTPVLDSHYEHRFVTNMMYAFSRITKLSLIEYRSPSVLDGWVPNFFIDISSLYDKKINVLQNTLISQNTKIYFTNKMLELFHFNYNCSKKGVNWIEQFNIKLLFD